MAKWYRVRGRLQVLGKGEPGNGNGNGNGENGNGENGNGNGDVEGITPEVPSVLPDPPPGVFPAPTPHVPILPLPDKLLETLPPGGVWPRPGADVEITGHYVALCYIPRYGWRYIIIDPDAIQMPQIDRPTPQPRR